MKNLWKVILIGPESRLQMFLLSFLKKTKKKHDICRYQKLAFVEWMWGSETHGLLIHDAGQRQNKNIILCYKLSPLSELMHLFFVHFISLFNVQRNELYLFAKAPSPEPNWKTFEENAFLKKKENKQKVIFFFFCLHVLLPHMFCVTGPLYQSIHC